MAARFATASGEPLKRVGEWSTTASHSARPQQTQLQSRSVLVFERMFVFPLSVDSVDPSEDDICRVKNILKPSADDICRITNILDPSARIDARTSKDEIASGTVLARKDVGVPGVLELEIALQPLLPLAYREAHLLRTTVAPAVRALHELTKVCLGDDSRVTWAPANTTDLYVYLHSYDLHEAAKWIRNVWDEFTSKYELGAWVERLTQPDAATGTLGDVACVSPEELKADINELHADMLPVATALCRIVDDAVAELRSRVITQPPPPPLPPSSAH